MRAAEQPSKPSILSLVPDGIPLELRARSQWVVWRLVLRDGRWAKVPYEPVAMRPARTNDPRTWRSFELALRRYERGDADGVGFVFSRDDPYAGIDLDGGRDPVSGVIEPWAANVLVRLNSYAEVSPSGTGIKVVVRGRLPCQGTGRRRPVRKTQGTRGKAAEIEAYHFGRFFALTGVRVKGGLSTIRQCDAELVELWGRFFGSTLCRRNVCPQRTPARARARSRFDEQRLDLARKARNGVLFSRLFDAGSLDEYDGDHSRADLALCGMLAFCTNRDPARIDRLFRHSALMRPKWDERHAADGATYGQMTIRRALCEVRGR
jgi:putative DNA primase/helicase